MKTIVDYIYESTKQESLKSNEDFVDLGLSVKWAKYNYGVNPDKLTSPTDWYGGYYAWGELKSKTNYSWSTYKYAKNSEWDDLTKYCPDNRSLWAYNKKTDNLTTLESEDDIITVKCGSDFRMPTKKEVNELLSLPNKWVTKYNDISGLNGILFTGKNGNTLFIPAAGAFNGTTYDGDGKSCFLWTSDINPRIPHGAWYLYSYSHETSVNSAARCLGQSIRAVAK